MSDANDTRPLRPRKEQESTPASSLDPSGLPRARVRFPFYGWELFALLCAFATVPVIWWLDGDADWLQRAGGVMVACALWAQFMTLGKANVKHIRNAKRLFDGETPQDFSKWAIVFSYMTFLAGLVGTVLWVFGGRWS